MSRSTRRQFIARSSMATLGPSLFASSSGCAERPISPHGYVVGEPTAEIVGARILASGGNAIDAIVAAALTAAITAPNHTGVGGYGLSAVLAVDSGKQIVAIDGNSSSPAAMQADVFRAVAEGTDKDRINEVGWLAAGVPGLLAGLQLAIDRFGTLSIGELFQPAIEIARNGFPLSAQLATLIRSNKYLERDPGSRRLYFPDGDSLATGSLFKNPELAEVLSALAKANSVEAFYRGDIAQQIADAFQNNGGLVTVQDLASYEAKVVMPLKMEWNGFQVHTAPLTAGGLTVLQIMQTLKAMEWDKKLDGIDQLHAKIEATRLAWHDRLTLLGDPSKGNIPIERLLSSDYAEKSAARILEIVEKKSYLRYPIASKPQGGTIHLSAIDQQGNMAALTLTHGEAFGAKVTIDGLGLTLGHGMSRFDPRPDHPNAPGPSKRPLHNMVPTIVTQSGQSVMAVGGRGGRKIVNAVLEILTQFVGLHQNLTTAMIAPRFHTEGNENFQYENTWPESQIEPLKKRGYTLTQSGSATLSAVAMEKGQMQPAMR